MHVCLIYWHKVHALTYLFKGPNEMNEFNIIDFDIIWDPFLFQEKLKEIASQI